MSSLDPRIRSLLRQASKVEESGKLAAAEQLYEQILVESPDTHEAWLGLARVRPIVTAKEEAYTQVLALDADNLEAQIGLADLRGEPVPDAWREKLALQQAPPEPEPEPKPPPEDEAEVHEYVCYRHPDRVTSLRCYSCGNPICSSCAQKTPVGYSCPDCKRELENKFFNAKPTDYLIAAAVSLVLGVIAGAIAWQISGGFFAIILAMFASGAVGSLIGRITKRAVGGRRGRYLPHVVLLMIILGVVIPGLPYLLLLLMGSVGVLTLFVPGIFLFIGGGAAFYWMK